MVERDLAKVEVAGSSPVIRSIAKKEEMRVSSFLIGSIAQLGEHLPYKQRVIGSSPIVPTKNRQDSKRNLSVLLFRYFLFTKDYRFWESNKQY